MFSLCGSFDLLISFSLLLANAAEIKHLIYEWTITLERCPGTVVLSKNAKVQKSKKYKRTV